MRLGKGNLSKSASCYSEEFDRKAVKRSFKPGSKVLLQRSRKHYKLEMCWLGPFEVLAKVSECDYRIRVNGKEVVPRKLAETVCGA